MDPQFILAIVGILGLVGGAIHVIITNYLFFIKLWRQILARISGQERRQLRAYVHKKCDSILLERAICLDELRVRDIITSDELFILPEWSENGHGRWNLDLTDYLVQTIGKGERVLILGEPGQGKTIVLCKLYNTLRDNFITKKDSLVPIYFRLRLFDYSDENHKPTLSNIYTQLHNDIGNPLPLSEERFRKLVLEKRIVFLLDGLDEIRRDTNQWDVNLLVESEIFDCLSCITCRAKFYEFYLSASSVERKYEKRIELLPLQFDAISKNYITTFCKTSNCPDVADTIHDILINSTVLRELAGRPLFISMIIETLMRRPQNNAHPWNIARLYRDFTVDWLMNEATKGDVRIAWQDLQFIIEQIAWYTYDPVCFIADDNEMRGIQRITFSRHQLEILIAPLATRYKKFSEMEIIECACRHTFLAEDHHDHLSFIHKSFQEYYVAKRIVNWLVSSSEETTQALQRAIPLEVATFVKQMLDSTEISLSNRNRITRNLIRAYRSQINDSERSVMIREQASYYLAVLNSRDGVGFLKATYPNEMNNFVKRGMMVGLARFCHQQKVMEEYIQLLRSDEEAMSINGGYHLVYYGDKPIEEDYRDDRQRSCQNTLRNLFRHLKSSSHIDGWVLDLITLRYFVEQRGSKILTREQYDEVKQFANRESDKLEPAAFQELQALISELKKDHNERHSEVLV